MKRLFFLLLAAFFLYPGLNLFAQRKHYITNGGETIFSWGQLEYTDAFKSRYFGAEVMNNPVRFTIFINAQELVHLDLNNSIGFFSGLAFRNVGMISDEVLPVDYTTNDQYQNTKIIRRTYSLGIPLAIKLGSFSDHFYVYGGGEYEWQFLMKEKYWDGHSRSGTKSKNVTWWPDQLTTFIPSAFVGIQFPKGVNLKFKYYLEDFLNHEYTTSGETFNKVVSDLSKYKSSQMMYISLSFMFNSSDVTAKYKSEDVACK